MYRRRHFGAAAALALTSLIPSDGAAQSARGPARASFALAGVAPTPAPAALKSAYHIRLTSTWPQEAAGACRNGGEETLDGTLERNADGTYSGSFARNTRLFFCGAHGAEAAPAEGCALTLQGKGRVTANGVVMEDETSPSGRSVRVEWSPVPGHSAVVTGACPAAFKDALRGMYLNTRHGAEIPLTTAGTGPRTERLENYAWIVELD
ncbi:MAG: hypothetical protein ACJ8DC_17910 [Gemmatimonadales bacterium]